MDGCTVSAPISQDASLPNAGRHGTLMALCCLLPPLQRRDAAKDHHLQLLCSPSIVFCSVTDCLATSGSTSNTWPSALTSLTCRAGHDAMSTRCR